MILINPHFKLDRAIVRIKSISAKLEGQKKFLYQKENVFSQIWCGFRILVYIKGLTGIAFHLGNSILEIISGIEKVIFFTFTF